MRILLVLLAISITSCTSTKFQVSNTLVTTNSKITFIDKRSEISKVGGKNSITDTYFFHSDDKVVPGKLALLTQILASKFGQDFESKIIIEKFEIVDHYAKRLRGAQSAGLASIGTFTPDNWNGNDDFIRCEIQILINNKKYNASHASAYKLKGNKMIVFDEEAYQQAVKDAVTQSLSKLL